jgi:hypothetical protein
LALVGEKMTQFRRALHDQADAKANVACAMEASGQLEMALDELRIRLRER